VIPWNIFDVCPAARPLFFATCARCFEWTVVAADIGPCPDCGAFALVIDPPAPA
jgi:hypothetical protein